MALQNDYIVRVITDMVRAIARLLFRKDDISYELPEKEAYTAADILYENIIKMAAEGKINEAENLLMEELDETDMKQFELALSFYLYLNTFDNDYLDDHDYSREEIREGIQSVSRMYGAEGIVGSLI